MTADSDIRAWARDRGVKIGERGRIPAGLRAEYEAARPAATRPIPGPDDIAEDLGIIDIDTRPGAAPPDSPIGDSGQAGTPAPPPPAGVPGPDSDGPAHARRDWHKTPKSTRPKARPTPAAAAKITATIRSDIEAKIGFALSIPGQIWAVRDPVCGGTFMGQLEPIAVTSAAWVIRSPALVDWFTSPAGSGFILFLDTAAALGPVLSAVMAHHVYHSISDEDQGAEAPSPYAQYAA